MRSHLLIRNKQIFVCLLCFLVFSFSQVSKMSMFVCFWLFFLVVFFSEVSKQSMFVCLFLVVFFSLKCLNCQNCQNRQASEIKRRFDHKLPANWKDNLPSWKPTDAAKATRNYSQAVIQKLAANLPELIGGSADLNPSTLTYMENSTDFEHKTPTGKNIRYGVREHGMAAISNGISSYGGFIPYCATFFNFIS